MMEWKKLGRRGTVTLASFFSIIFLILLLTSSFDYFILFSSFTKFWISIASLAGNQLAVEIYPTHLRLMATGYISSFKRVAVTLMPFMCLGMESLFNNIMIPYYEFLLCAGITFIAGMLIPHGTGDLAHAGSNKAEEIRRLSVTVRPGNQGQIGELRGEATTEDLRTETESG